MANNATTFQTLFEGMEDEYNGVYSDFLNLYGANGDEALAVLQRTITRFPTDQVPAIFIYQDPDTTIRTIHHLHQVETPLGQPANPLTDMYLGLSGEAYNGNVQLRQVPPTFFSATGNIIVPTSLALTVQLAAAGNGLVGPYNPGDPDTEQINTRRAVPVPYAYIRLMGFRNLTPEEAWQQVGLQIIADGGEQDCMILLNFLRAATVMVRGAGRNQPNGPPSTTQLAALVPPIDGPILQHTQRKLRSFLPGAFTLPAPNIQQAAHVAAVAAVVNQTVADGFEALRADRLQEREAAALPKSFSAVFPANAMGIRRLCMAGNDDEMLPDFWKFFAELKGKKGPGLSALTHYVSKRAGNDDSAGIRPLISTALYTNIANFELGASDLEIITQGVSPFLMCPAASVKAEATTILTQRYMMLQGESSMPLLSDIQQLVPSSAYSIPEDLYALVDFIGAYSVLWDVLVGPHHPLAITLRQHFKYWNQHVRTILKAIPEKNLRNVVIIGTLRHIQLKVMRYVNIIMFEEVDPIIPDFTHIEDALDGRLFNNFPGLPAQYTQPIPSSSASSILPTTFALPPMVTGTPTPPSTAARERRESIPVIAPASDKVKAHLDAFSAGEKSIQELRTVEKQPKTKNGAANLCLSYHLRGACFEACRRSSTHRKLEKAEEDNMKAFISKNL
jgi:hypothetical protein